MEQNTASTVQTTSDAIVSDNTIVSSTIVESTVHSPNGATVSDDKVPENISEEVLKAAHLKPVETTVNDLRVLRSIILQKKMANGEEEAIVLST